MNLPNSAPVTDWTFCDLADWYFAHYAANNLKELTQYNYRYIANRILLPELGDVPLRDFNNLMLTEWFAGLGHASINTTANIYTEVLDRTKAEAAREVAAALNLLE